MHGLDAAQVRSAHFDSLAVPETDEIVAYLRFQAVPRYVIHFRPLEVPRPLAAPPIWRAVKFCNDRYEQRLLDATVPQFAVGDCTRAVAKEVSSGRDVFLKLVRDHKGAPPLPRHPATALEISGATPPGSSPSPALAAALAPALAPQPTPRSRRPAADAPQPTLAISAPRHAAAYREAECLRAVGKRHAPELLATFELEGEGIVLVLECAHSSASLAAPCRRNLSASLTSGGVAASRARDEELGSVELVGRRSGRREESAGDSRGCYGGGSSDQASLLLLAEAQRVLHCVARVHEVDWVHCDVKPEHFMRFPPGGEIKLVDFGCVSAT